jgi:hypothetical protein
MSPEPGGPRHVLYAPSKLGFVAPISPVNLRQSNSIIAIFDRGSHGQVLLRDYSDNRSRCSWEDKVVASISRLAHRPRVLRGKYERGCMKVLRIVDFVLGLDGKHDESCNKMLSEWLGKAFRSH